MSILARIYKHTLGRVLPQPSRTVNKESRSKKRKHDDFDSNESNHRYQREEQENGIITKRRRVTEDHFAPIVNGEEYESTLIAAPSVPSAAANSPDKVLMPPPAISLSKTTAYDRAMSTNTRRESMDIDSVSQISLSTKLSPAKTTNESTVEYDMEKARRHAAATTLPENSGIWEASEKELFFHISYRGFEPLLPQNWMTDFRTLPLSLYQSDDEDAPPLIRAYKAHGEFRAIRELRELLDLGKNVRDKVLAAPGIKREDIIDRAVKKYIKWALYDAGIQVSSAASRRKPIPVYVQVKLKPRQSTTQCLAELKTKMHVLRAQHFRARNIHESIERDVEDVATPDSEGITHVAESSDDDLPVIYGIMIMKSILAVFTLNSRTPSPRNKVPFTDENPPRRHRDMSASASVFSAAAYTPTNGAPLVITDEGDLEDSASDARYISDFDFSDHRKDVWNAFVIAILAMQIRKDMLVLRDGTSDELEDICAGIEESSVIDDDPDA